LGELLLELLRCHVADGAVEPGRERGEVAAIRVHGLGRAPAREQREKAFDFEVAWRMFHRARFRGEPLIACLDPCGYRRRERNAGALAPEQVSNCKGPNRSRTARV